MKYGSVCSGIEAATVAWHPLGWKPSFFSEIEAFPRAVLEHHYPETPLHGDFTTIQDGDYDPVNLIVGGTPCQSYSLGGLREGLDDPRGNLMLGFGALAQRLRPTWLEWENVPGVLSSWSGGNPPGDLEEGQEWEAEERSDFGTFLTMLAELGYGFAYRVLDAKYFGVPCPRRRVFVVAYLGDWRPAAAVLFERESFGWNFQKGRSAGPVHPCLTARGARAFDDRTGYVLEKQGVRITTPLEHERLLGFPDNYTRIPYRNKSAENCPDGPRYKALGNSMAVPVMRWIGERIQAVDEALAEQKGVAA